MGSLRIDSLKRLPKGKRCLTSKCYPGVIVDSWENVTQKGNSMSQTDEKYLARLRERYRKGSKKERSAMLDEYVKTASCHRKHAIAVLSGKRKRAKGPFVVPGAPSMETRKPEHCSSCGICSMGFAPNDCAARWMWNGRAYMRMVFSK